MWACIHSSGDGITVLEITLDEVAHYLWSPSIGYMLKCQHFVVHSAIFWGNSYNSSLLHSDVALIISVCEIDSSLLLE